MGPGKCVFSMHLMHGTIHMIHIMLWDEKPLPSNSDVLGCFGMTTCLVDAHLPERASQIIFLKLQ